MDKIALLQEILAQNPNDAFARYGLAMEHASQGDTATALDNSSNSPLRIPTMPPATRCPPSCFSKAAATAKHASVWKLESPQHAAPATPSH